jgi:hypothetical protein
MFNYCFTIKDYSWLDRGAVEPRNSTIAVSSRDRRTGLVVRFLRDRITLVWHCWLPFGYLAELDLSMVHGNHSYNVWGDNPWDLFHGPALPRDDAVPMDDSG